MKKFRVSFSFLLFVLIGAITQKFTILLNYFLALSFHELAHLFVATSRGYSLQFAKLDMFGMSINLKEKISDKDNFAINIAGPACNFMLCIVCFAMYWLFPNSFGLLNSFCLSNFVLAVFNLLPITPLDGGKIFASFFQNSKHKKLINISVKIAGCVAFLSLFVWSCFNQINFWFLLVAVFFVLGKDSEKENMSIFKFCKDKKIEKVVILKINGEENLLDLVKKIRTNKYIIFYCNKVKKPYLDEDYVLNLATKYPLDSKIIKICS